MEILEPKLTIAEINNAMDGLNHRMETTEKRIRELEDRIESTQYEQE